MTTPVLAMKEKEIKKHEMKLSAKPVKKDKDESCCETCCHCEQRYASQSCCDVLEDKCSTCVCMTCLIFLTSCCCCCYTFNAFA